MLLSSRKAYTKRRFGFVRNTIPICLTLVIFLSLVSGADAQTNWAAEYSRLSKIIEERKPEPKESPNQLEPYLHWMEIKAGDRDEVDAFLGTGSEAGQV